MADDNWQKVREIFDSALRRPPEQRQKFVLEACDGDELLLIELQSLLDSLDSSESFMEEPAVAGVAQAFAGLGSKLESGYCLAHYKIIRELGSGGMGEVYLAHDQKLDRQVAVKILNEKFSNDESNLSRFTREAKAASALNHPNILVIHEIGEAGGTHYIVSEFVEGPTLREILREKVLRLSEILDVAVEIARALAAAHEARLIHRDIKPENIMIRPDGYVKILDFGLAKLVGEENRSILGLEGPAAIQNPTAKGVIMGTVNYMSPEQAKGEEVDRRTDIFSLGVVIYEMIAGRTPFGGDSPSETFANLLNTVPLPLSHSNSNVPEELQRVVTRMLVKDKNERFQTMEALLADLTRLQGKLQAGEKTLSSVPRDAPGTRSLNITTHPDVVAPSGSSTTPSAIRTDRDQPLFSILGPAPDRSLTGKMLIAAAALLVTAVGAAVFWRIVTRDRYQASLSPLASMKPLLHWDAEGGDVGARFSPRGTMIAYSLTKNGQRNIWTKQIPDGKANQVTHGKWNCYNPIWSPDGLRIAFISNREGQLSIWSMPFSGGEQVQVKSLESETGNLLHWSKDGSTIYYQQGFNLFALDIDSGRTSQKTNFDSTHHAQFFNISPGEDRVAYAAGPNERLRIFVMELDGRTPVPVTDDEASDEYPFWLPDGKRIVYSSKRNGVFQPWIVYLDELRTEQINLGISDTLIRDVASEGGRVLFQQIKEESDLWRLRIDDKSESQITADIGLELWPDVSPDGRNVVFQAATEAKHLLEGSILVRSVDNTEIVNIASNGFAPTFSPDGREVAFLRHADNLFNLWVTGINGGSARSVTTGGIGFSGFSQMPYNLAQTKDYGWLPDGRHLIYSAKRQGLWNIWQAPADGMSSPRQVTDNADPNIMFSCPLFGPDGKRLAYLSNAVKPVPGAGTTSLFRQGGESPEMLFSSEFSLKLLGWSRSGNGLIIAISEDKPLARPSKVKFALISGENRETEIATVESAYYHNMQLSPDGRSIAVATRGDDKDYIRIISTAGSGNTVITIGDPTVYIAGIQWSPDSKTVFFSKQKNLGSIVMIENFN